MNPEFDTIGRAFVQAYYEQFSSNRDALVSFYQQDSLLTYEGSQTQGLEGIGELYKVRGGGRGERKIMVRGWFRPWAR